MSAQPDISIDAEKWAAAKFWTWEEAEYLLVGLDHRKVQGLEPDVPLELKAAERRRVREALEFHFRIEEVSYRVSPREALEVATRAGIQVSDELVTAVSAASVIGVNDTPCVPTSADSRRYNKLLKMFFAVSCVRYGYDPEAARQSAISKMISDGELVGMKFDDATVRDRLREAVDLLNEDEEYRVSQYLEEKKAN